MCERRQRCAVLAEDLVVLDERIGQQALAHRRQLPGILHFELDETADMHVAYAVEAERRERPLDDLPLRVEDAGLGPDEDARPHNGAGASAEALAPTLVLGDEVLTPDSSRYWPADGYEVGHGQPSFDKQYVRDWASASGWDKKPPAPAIPDDVVAGTRARYIEAYERITGEPFQAWLDRTGAA